MEVAYYDWGGVNEPDYDQLDAIVKKVHQACLANSSCEVIELRTDVERRSQSIIALFADGSFDADNPVGIHRVERLALTFCVDSEFCWEVRALRKDFPITSYQNHILRGEPRSLCLYIEPWESVERSWTPELFLKRIFWWLRATADGTIHGEDQPIEHLFFSSHLNVILPENHFHSEDYINKKLFFTSIEHEATITTTLVGSYRENENKPDTPLCVPVFLLLPSTEIGPIEGYPHTLGQLHDILEGKGSDIINSLKESIASLVAEWPAPGFTYR